MIDTPQAPAESPEAEVKPDLASEAPETTAAAPPEPKPETVDGEEAGAEDQPSAPWWQDEAVDTEETLYNHESLKALREASDQESFRRGRSDTHKRMQGFLQDQTKGISSIDSNIQQFVADFRNLLEDSEKDTVKGLSRLLRDNKDTFAALQGLHQQGAWWVGKRDVVADIGKALDNGDLSLEFGPRFERLSQGDADPTIYTDLVEIIVASAKESWEKTERPKIEKQVKTRLEAQARDKARQAGSPPVKPKGGGGTPTPTKPKGQMTGEQRADEFEKKHGRRPRNM